MCCKRGDLCPCKSVVRRKEAVQALFKVKVASVHTSVYVGKMRRRGRTFGFRPDWKKAYVKLKAGEKVPEYVESE